MRLRFLFGMVDSGGRWKSGMSVVSVPQLAIGQEHSNLEGQDGRLDQWISLIKVHSCGMFQAQGNNLNQTPSGKVKIFHISVIFIYTKLN